MKMKTSLPIPLGGGSAELEISKEEGSAIKRFFGAATPGFIKDRVGILNDNAQLARYQNFCRIVHEAEEIRKKYGLESNPLPLKLGMKFIEEGSLEDDETIQNMWASLLANSTSGTTGASTFYISILKELTPPEAKVLNMFYEIIEEKISHDGSEPAFFTLSKQGIIKELKKQYSDSEVIIENLFRQGLIQYTSARPNRLEYAMNSVNRMPFMAVSDYTVFGTPEEKPTEADKVIDYLKSTEKALDSDSIQLTTIGFALVKACNEPLLKQNS